MAYDREALATLYKKYKLTEKDIFKQGSNFVIITRPGIEKIQAQDDILVSYSTPPELQNPANRQYVVLASAHKKGDPDVVVQSYGESAPINLEHRTKKDGKTPIPLYPMALAEKRALSRAVLKLTGFYRIGVMGEDESDEFGDKVKEAQGKVEFGDNAKPPSDRVPKTKTTEVASS